MGGFHSDTELWQLGTSSEENPRRVGTFGRKIANDGPGLGYTVLMSVVVGLVFGGIHCIAWTFVFPSDIEQLLWRISALSVTCTPLLLFLLSAAVTIILEKATSETYAAAAPRFAVLVNVLVTVPALSTSGRLVLHLISSSHILFPLVGFS